MSKYCEMSDFDINLRVACAIDCVPVGEDGKPEFAVDCFLSVNNSQAVKWLPSTDGDEYTFFNPCNTPTDAWPIVLKHRIMLNPYCADNLWKAEVPCGREDSFTTYATCYHKNPLRAAMIVFLMMQEAANV